MSPPHKKNHHTHKPVNQSMTPRDWTTFNQQIWALLGAILLSSIVGLVVYSHWVYFGCELARDSEPSRLSIFRDMLNPTCPATDLLPKTPLQTFALSILPYNAEVAKYSYGMACKKSVLASGTAICESLFALSYLSAISEWAFYLYVIIRVIHNFVWKPVFSKLLTLLVILSVGLLVGKLGECYAPTLFGEELAVPIVYWSQLTSRVICEAAAFVCSVCISVFHSVQKTVLVDEYPGASLLRSVQTAVPIVKARLEEWRASVKV